MSTLLKVQRPLSGSRLTVAQRRALKSSAGSYLMLAPKLILFTAFTLVPFGWAFYLTLERGSIFTTFHFAGFSNYRLALSDQLFWYSVQQTLRFLGVIVPAELLLGLVLALALNRVGHGKRFFRLAVSVPLLSSAVAAALVWGFILDYDLGAVNTILTTLGLSRIDFFASPIRATLTVSVIEVWRSLGFYALVFLAGLQGIPAELQEAARIDGATSWKVLRYITLPLLKPTVVFALVMTTIWNLQIFDTIYVVTSGGPGFSTYSVVFYIYQNALTLYGAGRAATMSFLLLVMILAVVGVQLLLLREREDGGATLRRAG